jgi:NhaP-type Na+/H+ or K+/H+ antiporter
VLACTLAVVTAVLLDGEGRENHPALVAAVVLAVYGVIAGSLTLAAFTLRRAIQR